MIKKPQRTYPTEEAPFTGSFSPRESLSSLYGTRAAGTWQLEIQDTLAGDNGTLNQFKISLCFEDTDNLDTGNTDTDGDGVSNDLDQCPATLAGSTVNENGCALSQLDSDNDGVSDELDQCPNTPAGEEVDETGCANSNSQLTYVPDDNFEQALIDLGYDDELDDYVSTQRIAELEELKLYNRE